MPGFIPEAHLRYRQLIWLVLVIAWLVMGWLGPAPALARSMENQATPASLPGIPLALTLDGQPYPLRFLAFQDAQERLMISLSDCQQLFGQAIAMDDNGLLTMQGNGHVLQIPPSDYIQYASWSTLSLPTGESVQLDIIYLPLQLAAGEWQYRLTNNPPTATIELYSPGWAEKPAAASSVNILPEGLPVWGSLAAVPAMNSLWPDEKILGGYYTAIIKSSANRINNIVLSCASINGWLMESREVFAFNRAVGQRTLQRGYRVAPVYSGKKVVSGVGGGICQTSTTLYNATRECGLTVLERHHHTLPVHYIADGNDATVSWGTADFRFRNNQSYPVKILAQVYQNHVIIALARAD